MKTTKFSGIIGKEHIPGSYSFLSVATLGKFTVV